MIRMLNDKCPMTNDNCPMLNVLNKANDQNDPIALNHLNLSSVLCLPSSAI